MMATPRRRQYVNPNPGATGLSVDMGVDLHQPVGAPIEAMGPGTFLGIVRNWYRGQPYVAYKLDSGPVLYEAEEITPEPLRPGQRLRAGQVIGHYAATGTGIEAGLANPLNWRETLAQAHGHGAYAVRHAPGGTAEGRQFLRMLTGSRGTRAPVRTPGRAAGSTQRQVVNQAARAHHVDANILWGIYGAESSWGVASTWFGLTSDYPHATSSHPFASSGNFTTDANRAAQILSNLLHRSGGDYEKALRLYSGGGYGLAHIRDLLAQGGSKAGGAKPPGRSRPGGGTGGGAPPDGTAAIESIFASYTAASDPASQTQNADFKPDPSKPFGGVFGNGPDFTIPNPLDLFNGPASAINSVVDALKWIAWIFHPKNILRIVEFLTGITIMGLGIQTMIQVSRQEQTTPQKAAGNVKRGIGEAVSMSPVGRGARAVRGASAGKRAARASQRNRQYAKAQTRSNTKEKKRIANKDMKRGARQLKRKGKGEIPF